jgi:hypothetical protein
MIYCKTCGCLYLSYIKAGSQEYEKTIKYTKVNDSFIEEVEEFEVIEEEWYQVKCIFCNSEYSDYDDAIVLLPIEDPSFADDINKLFDLFGDKVRLELKYLSGSELLTVKSILNKCS